MRKPYLTNPKSKDPKTDAKTVKEADKKAKKKKEEIIIIDIDLSPIAKEFKKKKGKK